MKKYIIIVAILAIITSCAKVITPYYTTIEKMYAVDPGMTVAEVNNALGISPYELYVDLNTGNKIVVYLYRYRMQQVPVTKTDREEYLSNGRERYAKEGKMYAVFGQGDGKLLTFITDAGRQAGLNEIKWENRIRYIVQSPANLVKMKNDNGKKDNSGMMQKRKKSDASAQGTENKQGVGSFMKNK